jgi:hypothetical protein
VLFVHQRHLLSKTHKNSDIKLFAKKYPGFIVACVFAIIVLILLGLYLANGVDEQTAQNIALASQFHEENIYLIEGSLEAVNYEINGNYEEEMEEYYLLSMQDDLEWLLQKENELALSTPPGERYLKLIAIKVMYNRIKETNEFFVEGIYTLKDTYIINKALSLKPKQNLISEEELNITFEEELDDREIFVNALEELIKNYYSHKKSLITNSDIAEIKFVEAKKLLFFSYD